MRRSAAIVPATYAATRHDVETQDLHLVPCNGLQTRPTPMRQSDGMVIFGLLVIWRLLGSLASLSSRQWRYMERFYSIEKTQQFRQGLVLDHNSYDTEDASAKSVG